MPRYMRGALAVAAAVLVAWAVLSGRAIPDAVVILVLVAAFALGWPPLTRLPQPMSATLAIAVVGAAGVGHAMSDLAAKGIGILLGVVGAGLIVAFVREMLRPPPRTGLVASLGATVTGMVGAALLAGWLWVPNSEIGHAAVLAGCAAVAGAGAAGSLPLGRWWEWLVVMAGAVGAAALAAALAPGDLPLWAGLVLGVVVGLVSGVAHAAFDPIVAARPLQGAVAAAVVPLAVAALPVFAVVVWLG